jgi:hypothetical protein
MTSGQWKLLIAESAVLGIGLGFCLTSFVDEFVQLGDFRLGKLAAYSMLGTAGLVIALQWIKLRGSARIKGLDDFFGHNDSSEGCAVAEMEVDTNIMDKELWSKALMKAEGDDNRRKFEHMKLQTAQIKTQREATDLTSDGCH